jgi:hypothetical protein
VPREGREEREEIRGEEFNKITKYFRLASTDDDEDAAAAAAARLLVS